MVVVTFKIICLVPVLFLLLLSSFGIFEKEANVSHVNVISEMEEYTAYVLQIEDDVKLSKRVQKNTLNSINRLLHASEKEKPKNLIKLLTKSKGFRGVLKRSPKFLESGSSDVTVALPNIAKDNVKGLLVSMTEGLEFVKHIEESLNINEELVKARKASTRVGIEVELYLTWLQFDLKKMAHKGKTSKDILQWLGDRAAKIVQSKSNKDGSIDHSNENVLAANSMYRISQTILIHCSTEQEEWPTDEEVFEWVSKIIADIFLACFTYLPRVITLKCHHDAIEKRQDSIRTAARILGKSKVIMNILKGHQLPNLDMDSMAYLDKWHALPKSQMPEDSPSLNESLELTIIPFLEMSAMWLVPQQVFHGLSEALNIIGQMEFYYSEFPKSMLSVATSLYLLGAGIGSLLGSLILNSVDAITKEDGKESWVSTNINKGHYDNYYWLLVIMSCVNYLYYVVCSWAYGPLANRTVVKGQNSNNLDEEDTPRT
ncbi:hypothetical protein CTI12_AA371220 [Artemisia annua]|uniref:Proton-dependent oligopeptide transporter family n=1 Tax=Artemisia annua TaxID=35608 RepID=A0A2U1MJM4_ARTAN|nr:hypothetical protein CTI12_AA371220 [Artemisia annua]